MMLSESTVADAVRQAMDDPQMRTLLTVDRALRARKVRGYLGYTCGAGHCFLQFQTSAGEQHVHIGVSGELAGNVTVEELAEEAA